MDHQEEPWGQQPPCEGDPGFLPRGVPLILTFGAGFSASISQASAEALWEERVVSSKQNSSQALSPPSKMAAVRGSDAKGV